jgi:hypothetical protein
VKGITDGSTLARRVFNMASPCRLACPDLGGQRPGAGHRCKHFQSADDVRRDDRVMLQKMCARKHHFHFQSGVFTDCRKI